MSGNETETNKKVCPIMNGRGEGPKPHFCIEDSCAWYLQYSELGAKREACAMALAAVGVRGPFGQVLLPSDPE